MTDIQFEHFRNQHRNEDYNSPIQQEIRCISMINSIICYHWNLKDSAKSLLDWEIGGRYHSYLQQYVDALGYDKVLTLMQKQMDDICDIKKNVYTDCEGVTYNSIIWRY